MPHRDLSFGQCAKYSAFLANWTDLGSNACRPIIGENVRTVEKGRPVTGWRLITVNYLTMKLNVWSTEEFCSEDCIKTRVSSCWCRACTCLKASDCHCIYEYSCVCRFSLEARMFFPAALTPFLLLTFISPAKANVIFLPRGQFVPSFDHWTIHLPIDTRTPATFAQKLNYRIELFKT